MKCGDWSQPSALVAAKHNLLAKKKEKGCILDTFLTYRFLSNFCLKNMNSNSVARRFFSVCCHP